jgi:putative transposase
MNIKHRVGLPRMSFHAMNRGARKAIIFSKDGDKRVFVDLLGRFCLKHGITLSAWCLMPNHYHTEPEGEGTPLSRMMHDLDGTYARFYNETYDGSGCLFQGPYKTMSISDDRGLAYVSRYIHLNSRDLGVDPIQYPWSSCRSYLGLEPTPPWLDPTPVLRQFGEDLESARTNYRFYLQSAPPRRRKVPPGEEPVDDFLVDYIGHLESLWAERFQGMGWPPRTLSMSSFICWYANRRERIPFHVLREYFGLSSLGSVRVTISKFARRLENETDLAKWFDRVNIQASPQR